MYKVFQIGFQALRDMHQGYEGHGLQCHNQKGLENCSSTMKNIIFQQNLQEKVFKTLETLLTLWPIFELSLIIQAKTVFFLQIEASAVS